ncbi:Uncharacterised protein [Dermatophilus congolensis]|uniref:Uncharacterized protein n=1 Tax=Dermatophilus congolensis TaxID=1863 RepID=A0AA46BQ50_9MICO|nr:hypothetical protein [Dermatophilus congolensis]STD14998.1 Uncharacterised protein [Dermatophilus congolensis]
MRHNYPEDEEIRRLLASAHTPQTPAGLTQRLKKAVSQEQLSSQNRKIPPPPIPNRLHGRSRLPVPLLVSFSLLLAAIGTTLLVTAGMTQLDTQSRMTTTLAQEGIPLTERSAPIPEPSKAVAALSAPHNSPPVETSQSTPTKDSQILSRQILNCLRHLRIDVNEVEQVEIAPYNGITAAFVTTNTQGQRRLRVIDPACPVFRSPVLLEEETTADPVSNSKNAASNRRLE